MTAIPDHGFRLEDLPPLPIITSDAILLQVYTHRSVYARPTHVFEDAPGDPSPDNEKLEHLGDSVLGLCVTILIRHMYPSIRVGPATKIRAIVVGNPTLASIAVRYQMHKSLRLHTSQAVTLRASTNIQADVFESYIAGVYLTRGLDVVQAWLTALMTPYTMLAYRVIRTEYGLPMPPNSEVQMLSPPQSPFNNSPQGDSVGELAVAIASLSLSPASNGPVLAPHYDGTMSQHALTPSPLASIPSGHLSLLNQHLQQRDMAIDWVWTSADPLPGMSTPQWEVCAMLEGECLGTGKARSKKEAKNMAAVEALKALGVEA